MDTEDFSFPRISDTCAHNIDSPPLWNLSPAASPNPYQGNRGLENDCFGSRVIAQGQRKSFSCVENRRKRFGFDDDDEEEEERMDLLWEDFNEELSSTSTTGSATCSSREGVELTVAKTTTSNGAILPTKSKPGLVVIVKVMKKLFAVKNPQGKSRIRSLSLAAEGNLSRL